MKKILLVVGLLCNLYGLDEISALPENQKKMVSRIIEVLELPSNTKNKQMVFDKLDGFLTNGWSSHWTSNSTGESSKIKKSKTQICDVTIYNNNRVINCTFVHFKKEKQLFVTVKQYVSTKSSTALKYYNERKTDSKYTIENETDNYAYFNKNGYMEYETYHIKSPVGMIVYESSYFLNVN